MRFKLPKQLKIGATTFAVKTVDHLDEDRGRWGEADYRNCEIRLCSDLPAPLELRTWLHEILHCVAEDRGVRLKEEDCDKLASGLAACTVDNNWRVGAT